MPEPTGDKIEIIIKKDASKTDVYLSSMPVDTAKSFLAIIAAFVEIAENSVDKDGISVSIFEGSSGVALIPEQTYVYSNTVIPNIYGQFNDVRDRKIEDQKIMSPWQKLQRIAKQNGFIFQGGFSFGGKTVSLMPALKECPDFKPKRSKSAHAVTIEFFQTELNTAGGEIKDRSIIKIRDNNGKRISIKCSHSDIVIAREYVQEDVLISAWKTVNSKGNASYKLCDVYHAQSGFFETFKDLTNRIFNADSELEGLSILHDTLRSYLDVSNFDSLREFTRLFIHKSIPVDMLKTILVVTKSFKNHPEYMDFRKQIFELLEKPKRKSDRLPKTNNIAS